MNAPAETNAIEIRPISMLDKLRIGVGALAVGTEISLLAASWGDFTPDVKQKIAITAIAVFQSIPVLLDIDQGRKG